ncbi:MAG: NHLP leader peptide family RiPP precursor [Chloroflexi bacterium]|nr:NHLP leader peptide family RiPP precursor [Chloroflexota bacterium]
MATTTMSEMKAQIMQRAAEDDEFRARLLADPKPVISAELGVAIPERFTIQVHEDDATSAHLVLPLSDHLTDEELAEIAAGVDVNWDTVNIS